MLAINKILKKLVARVEPGRLGVFMIGAGLGFHFGWRVADASWGAWASIAVDAFTVVGAILIMLEASSRKFDKTKAATTSREA